MEGDEGRARLQCQVKPVAHALHQAAQNETNLRRRYCAGTSTVLTPRLYRHINCTGTSIVLEPQLYWQPNSMATQLYCHLNCHCHLNCTGNSTVLYLRLNCTGTSTVMAHELYWHSVVLPPQLQWRLNCKGTSTVTVPLQNFENNKMSKFWLS
jgi:hypothetical protein